MAKKSKSSEHGLGAFVDDRKTAGQPLHIRIWDAILRDSFGSEGADFSGLRFPARRRVPLNRPSLLKPFGAFNRGRPYRDQVKPFGFLQTVTAATQGSRPLRIVAPFEPSTTESRTLPWMDLASGDRVELDWFGTYAAGTVPVQRLDEFAKRYAQHPEEKGADNDGNPAGAHYKGILGRLHVVSRRPTYIGKEVDRLSEDEAMTLDDNEPVHYEPDDFDEELEEALQVLKQLPQAQVAESLGMSIRRYRDVESRKSVPRAGSRQAILELADEVRAETPSDESDATCDELDGVEESGTTPNPLVVGGLVLAAILGMIWFGSKPRT